MIEEITSALPIILSLIIIEGLLSVDNAMAIAAMASGLPEKQQKLALRLGILGAYGFRGICLLLVSWIAQNMWLKVFGAAYLIYLAYSHLHEEEQTKEDSREIVGKSLVMTIISIELMDLSLSLDNVVAAVALDKRIWVICTGVFIGILALRFVAGYCIELIKVYPVLKKTAFILVGFVGMILLTEITLEHFNIEFHINAFQKFAGIMLITFVSLWYEEQKYAKEIMNPFVFLFKLTNYKLYL